MTQDHWKLDAKSIYNYIMTIVKDSPTVPVSTLIANMQTQFQYRVSYRKAWWEKQMAMQQSYGNWNESYNELQEWILAMVQNVPGTVVDLQMFPYRGLNGQLEPERRVFCQLFWTFGPCVRAISYCNYCKPLVQVDGTWLYGKYTHILLIAVAQDGQGQDEDENIIELSDTDPRALLLRFGNPRFRGGTYCICHIAINFHNEDKNKD
ncbi:hypothetical protein J1N35_000991 [Gossypium stocksii]|uniref:Uncharacterized protein n=1 Tax=Gossypium stocksii TaxID=47602 RepID=A0A9D3WJL1_9ROSI|nr:hypothetical protein J1N35_000991 [Gossypium stocksii]